jgi:lambda repressor-like predicted transcriptional regulator
VEAPLIASDWISAYKRYFKTESPLRDYETSPLTELDRELILSELEELGVSTRHLSSSNGQALMTTLRMIQERSGPRSPQLAVKFAVFRPHP